MLAFRHRAVIRRAPAEVGQGVVELTMKGLLSRGNLILCASWAMALGMFLVRGQSDAGEPVGSKAHHAPAVRDDLAVPAAAAVIAAEPGAALTRNDTVRALQ